MINETVLAPAAGPNCHDRPSPGDPTQSADTQGPWPIHGVEFVALDDLPRLGFTDLFVKLCRDGFPAAGSYMEPKSAIGL